MTPWTAAHQASLSFTTSWSLLKLMSIELVMPSNHLILCHPLSSCPQSFPESGVFSNQLALRIRWPKYWSFSIGPSNEYPGLFPLGLTGLTCLISKLLKITELLLSTMYSFKHSRTFFHLLFPAIL